MASNTLPPGCSMHPSIDVVDMAHGRGLRAARPIKAGEVLLYAPAAAQLDGIDADALAATLLAELQRGTHAWLSSLPRDVAYSAAMLTTADAPLLRHRGRRARGLRVRAQRGPDRGTRTNAGRGASSSRTLGGSSGHLRLAPLFTLLNHGEDGLRPTELEDGALRLEAARDLRPGDDVRINYGHWSTAARACSAATDGSRRRLRPNSSSLTRRRTTRSRVNAAEAPRWTPAEPLRSDVSGPNEALELASLLPVLSSNSRVVVERLDRGEDGDDVDVPLPTSRRRRRAACSGCSPRRRTATSRTGGSSAGRRSSRRGARHCWQRSSTKPSPRREGNAASAIAGRGGAASLREHLRACYRLSRRAALERCRRRTVLLKGALWFAMV